MPQTEPMFRKLLLLLVTAGYAWVIWRMTLTPQVFTQSGQHLVDVVLRLAQSHTATAWLSYDRAEFLANIGMFVPVGAIGALWLPRRAWQPWSRSRCPSASNGRSTSP